MHLVLRKESLNSDGPPISQQHEQSPLILSH